MDGDPLPRYAFEKHLNPPQNGLALKEMEFYEPASRPNQHRLHAAGRPVRGAGLV